VNEITAGRGLAESSFGKACLMTSTTDTAHELTPDDALVTAAETAAHDQDDAAHDDAARDHAAHAADAARTARRESRAMAAAWVSLVAGLALTLGVFSSIAWENSVAANGPSHSVGTTAP